jgi:hypothetical protein
MGWDFAVFLHALGVLFLSGESCVTEQMIEKEMERDR